MCLICFMLISAAIILDDMAILLAGGTLGAAVLGRSLIFDHRMREIISSVSIQRSLSKNSVRNGTPVSVSSEIVFQGSSWLQIEISDLLPPNTQLIEGNATVISSREPGEQTKTCTYRIVPLIHGTPAFSGISVSVRDPFFEGSITMTRPEDCEPVLSVLPSGLFTPLPSESSDGTRDSRRMSTWSGSDIHSLREYQTGDDLRHADWKVSAKYGKIFIRRYSLPTSLPPFIIVDLPEYGEPYPEKEFDRMIAEVTGLVRHTIETFQKVSVLIISGPNIIHLIREEKNLSRCMSWLQEGLHPAHRPVHFYHMQDRTDLRSHLRDVEHALALDDDTPAQVFFSVLQDRFIRTLQYHRASAFSGQVARTISPFQMSDAFLFSLGCSDTSHIRQIVRPLQSQHIRVHIRIIGEHPGTDSGLKSPAPSSEVQV
ncbi:MAG TPA: DUF58 domain-containing protein [Methanoregulaceae archaeon]|nr:DUF58 domain-containing protein [Methanoregulaceae archaeon]